MKKLLFAALVLASAAAFAALDFAGAKADLLLAPASIASGTTNTVEFTSAGRKGVGEIIVAATSASTNVTLSVVVYREPGDALFAVSTFKADPTNGVYRLPLPCAYLTATNKLCISSAGGASTASAVILAY